MKKKQKILNLINSNRYVLNIIYQLVIIFVHFSFILNNELTKILYIKTNGNINEIKINNESLDILDDFTDMDTSNYFFRKEIQYQYGEEIIINITKQDTDKLSVGILFQIGNNSYKLNDSDFIIFINEENKDIICDENINININDSYIEQIPYCYINNSRENETKIRILIENNTLTSSEINEFNCFYTCLNCSDLGNISNHNCQICINGYYFKEDDNIKNCYNNESIEDGYYLDLNDNLFKKCNYRCLTCEIGGNNISSNCLKCDNNYYFHPDISNHCINSSEFPTSNYYLDLNDNKYKLCHNSCLTCNGSNYNNCLSCDNDNSYYFIENDNSNICYRNGTQGDGYYLDLNDNLFKKCNYRCLTCEMRGNNTNSDCLKCNDNYYFHPDISNHCINSSELPTSNYYVDLNDNKYKLCHNSCLTCNGSNYNNCLSCDNDNSYYFIENDNSNICYRNGTQGDGYYLDLNDKLFKKCNYRCLTCKMGGNNTNSNCLKCNNNYHFHPYKTNHCINLNELPTPNYYVDLNDNKYKLCHNSCLTCNDSNYNNCLSCNNDNSYYFIENNYSNICYRNGTLEDGYYLDLNDKLFKKCNYRCLTCKMGGNNTNSNCLKCNNNYHFHPYKINHCINLNELPTPNYYLYLNDNKYKLCHNSCLTCNGSNYNNCLSCNGKSFFKVESFENRCLSKLEIPNNYYYKEEEKAYYQCNISCAKCSKDKNNCTECNLKANYYPLENKRSSCLNITPEHYYFDNSNKIIRECHQNCQSCSDGFNPITREMNCDTCKENYYFQNISSRNCIKKPDYYYYISNINDKGTLFPCHKNCLTCEGRGNDTNNNCTKCIENLYLDDEITTNCVDDDIECAIGCAKCYKNRTNDIYGILSSNRMCKRCSHKTEFYPLQKYGNNHFYVSCYPKTKSPINYFFDKNDKVHKLCYQTCQNCSQSGNDLNHSCTSCAVDHVFIEEEPNNCYPKCEYYYYYTKNKIYRCTETYECPSEYPYLIANKSKCVNNCYDEIYPLKYKNECLNQCPEGTIPFKEIDNNGIISYICVASEIMDEVECQLNLKSNNIELGEDITEEVLNKYAKEYVHEHPISNEYVTSYTYTYSSNKYLIIIYKLEKCPKEKVEGYISLGLDECIQKVKKENKIIGNVVVNIIYIIKDNSPPQINYYLYHPDTGKKLDKSICSGTKLAFRTSLFDYIKVDEELVKYFSKQNINIFDINDPFFTDICSHFSKDGKDVPLSDRIKLYFQNVSLCENGCICVGINLVTYEVECSCDAFRPNTDNDDNNIIFDNPLSDQVIGFLKNLNLEVLKCIRHAFNKKYILINYGGLIMIVLFLVQIITSIIFIICQSKDIKNNIYFLINKINFPPKSKNVIEVKNINNNRKVNYVNDNSYNSSYNSSYNNSDNNSVNEKNKRLSQDNTYVRENNKINNYFKNVIKFQLYKRKTLNINNNNNIKKTEKNQYIENDSHLSHKKTIKITKTRDKELLYNINNSGSNIISYNSINSNSNNNSNISDSENEKNSFDLDQKNLNNLNEFENMLFRKRSEEIKLNNMSKLKPFLEGNTLDIKFNKKKSIFTSNSEVEKEKYIKKLKNIIIFKNGVEKEVKNIKKFKRKMKKNFLTKIEKRENDENEKEKRKKEKFVFYEHKKFSDKEINDLDYDEAIIYDKRNFITTYFSILKERQIIFNTFCSKDPFKPISIKILVMNFNFICYFVINGLLYNEDYISYKLKCEGTESFYEYINDSIERISFASIVGGIISFIMGIFFNIEKKIEDAREKYNNNKILLKGEISKIYKCNNILIKLFLFVQFICMVLFTIYIFCFCYVYPNNIIDWIESSLIVIMITQLLSLFTCLLISFTKYLGVKFHWELCFKINAYIKDK